MRWPWRRSREVTHARQEAERKLAETRQQGEEVRRVSEQLRQTRRENRFADMILRTMRTR